jgi:hypothetical protein
LRLSSGFREGDPGDHGRRKAIDMSGPASAMAQFAYAMFGRPGIKDVIYAELGSWQDNGRMVNTWAGNEGYALTTGIMSTRASSTRAAG